MSTAAEKVREPGLPAVYAVRGADHDNIVFLREASWDDFQALLRMRGEHSAPRLSYLCGEVEIYRKLGVAEVWWWRKGRLTPYGLGGEHYTGMDHSRVLPELDLAQLASFLDQPTAYDAIRAYRAALTDR